MNKIILFLISGEIVFIIILIFNITQKNKNILGLTSINPIKKEAIVFTPTDKLKYFYEPKPNTTEADSAYWLIYKPEYTINSDTLNERFEYLVNKPKDTYRIITLGDSFTFGMWVNTKDNWTELLEDKLNNWEGCNNIKKFEIINLGISGYDIEYSVQRYKLRGQKYNPNLILWLLKDDDFSEINEVVHPIFNYYWNLYKSQDLLDEKLIDGEYSKVAKYARSKLREKFTDEQIFVYQQKALLRINKYLQGELFLISFPSLNMKYKQILKNLADSSNKIHYYFDLVDINKSGEVLPDNFHPTKKGHLLIAEDLFKVLTKNKIIPCN